MKKYFNYQVHKELIVQNLITIEKLDIAKEFAYPAESHSFYEVAYVDSGEICCRLKNETVILQQGDLLLIHPNCAHAYSTSKTQSAAIFIVCFQSRCEYLSILDKKIQLSKDMKRIIADIVNESMQAFVFPFDRKLKPLSTGLFGAQQMIENNMERLLIYLVRERINTGSDIVFVMNSVELEHSLCNEISDFLKEHIYGTITLDQICENTFYSKTFLNTIFKKSTGMPIIKYYNYLKIQEAKRMIRKGDSIAAVSAKLDFESTTYFTKVFKRYTNMTPSEYKKTLLK